MRLIDADALKEFIDDCGICAICPQKAPRCSYDCDFPDFVTEKWNVAIDAQPTIDAVEWIRRQEVADVDIKERVINRMEYEFEKDLGIPPTYHKGKYGAKYDSCTCGNCGAGLAEPYWKFCPNCGYRVERGIK